MEEPAKPFVQLLYVLPVFSLNLLPEVLVNAVLDENSPIKKYYPEKYEFRPTDQIKEYTWEPDVKYILEKDMNAFVQSFDWSQLSKYDDRNRFGRPWKYQFDATKTVDVGAEITDVSPFQVNISAEQYTPAAVENFDFNDFSFLLKQSVQRFPTLNIYPFLRVKKIRMRSRNVFFILLSQLSLQKYFTEFTLNFKDYFKPNPKEINVYFGTVYKKVYRMLKIEQVSKSNPQFDEFEKHIRDYFHENYFLVPDQLRLANITNVLPVVCVAEPIFAHANKNVLMKVPKVSVVNDNKRVMIPFCFISICRGYESLNLHTYRFDPDYFDNSLLLNLRTGDTCLTQDISKNRDAVACLRANPFTQNIKIKNDASIFTQLEHAFVSSLGLSKANIHVLWIVAGSLMIHCDKNLSSFSVLGDAFDVGLNFINYLNKDLTQWAVVSDMVKLRVFDRRDT